VSEALTFENLGALVRLGYIALTLYCSYAMLCRWRQSSEVTSNGTKTKAETNLSKHGVSFDEATTAFEDPQHLIFDDGSDAARYILIGVSARSRLVTVVHVERGERERIISARSATLDEAQRYRED